MLKLSKIEQMVLNHVTFVTKKQLNAKERVIGLTTHDLSEELQIDRANLSRTLNKLNKSGLIIKKMGRPVLFISRNTVLEESSLTHLPTILQKDEHIFDYISPNHKDHHKTSSQPLTYSLINPVLSPSLYQSLKDCVNALGYPPDGLDILISGSLGVGKSRFIELLYEHAIEKNIFDSSTRFILINCKLLSKSTLELTLNAHILDKGKKHFVVLENFEQLSELDAQFMVELLSQRLGDRKGAKSDLLEHSYILVTSQSDGFVSASIYYQLISTNVHIPNIDERSVREKMAYILYFFQLEADNVQKPIRLSRNILNCFMMSQYPLNVYQIKSEIKSAVLHNIHSSNSPLVDVVFDDLTERLLTNIPKTFDYVEDLDRIYSQFDFKEVYLTPNEISNIYKKICSYNPHVQEQEKDIRSGYSFCEKIRNDIIDAREVLLNEIKVQDLDELSELVRPFLLEHPILSNDNMYYYLLNFMKKGLKQGGDNPIDFSTLSFDFRSVQIKDIYKALASVYDLNMTQYTFDYIDTYLLMSKLILEKQKVFVIIMGSEEKNVNTYNRFAESLNIGSNFDKYLLNIVEHELNPVQTIDKLKKYIEARASEKGSIILCTNDFPSKILDSINQNIENTLVMHHFTVSQLEIVLSLSEQEDKFLFDFESYIHNESIVAQASDEDLLQTITDKILTESLLFLNPVKISKVSYECLQKITNALDIELSEKLTIQFVTHTSFMVERLFNDQVLQFSDSRRYISENTRVFQMIEEFIQPIRSMFDISIPQSEIIYLCEIVLNQQ